MQVKTTLINMIFAVILSGVFFTGIVSCKKDKNENPPPSASSNIKEYKNGDDFVRFDYNADGTIKKATLSSELVTDGNTIDYNITYNAQKKIAFLQSSAGEKIVPVYENNSLVKADIFEGTEKTGFTSYEYENARLKKVTLYWGSGNDFSAFFQFIFSYDNNGNISETAAKAATQILGQLEPVGHVSFQYDAKTNPLYAHNDLLALFWQAASKNNIAQEDHFDASQLPEDRYVYTYTYKSNGLPQHADVKIGLPGQPGSTSQVEYVY